MAVLTGLELVWSCVLFHVGSILTVSVSTKAYFKAGVYAENQHLLPY
jgi:hypothetical protein